MKALQVWDTPNGARGDLHARQGHFLVTTGTPPLAVASTTLVPNLNADTVDGQHASAFALAADFAAHMADSTDAHDASAISVVPAGGIAATTVQAALEELDTEKAAVGHDHTGTYQSLDADLTSIAGLAGTSGLLRKTAADTWSLDTTDLATQAELDAHTGDAADAHDASAISFAPVGAIAAVTVQAALAELDTEKLGVSAKAADSELLDGRDSLAFVLRETSALGDLNTIPADIRAQYQHYINAALNKPVSVNNANGLLTLVSHGTGDSGTFGKQIAFGDNDDLYIRKFSNGAFSSWRKLIHEASSINGSQLTDATVVESKIISLPTTKLTGTIGTTQIADSAVTDAKVASGVAKSKISAAGTWAEADIPTLAKSKISGSGQWTETDIPVLTAAKYADALLKDGSRVTDKLVVKDVDATPVADRQLRVIDGEVRVETTGGVEGAFLRGEGLKDGSVGNAKISALAASKLTGTVATAQIADDAVTLAKLADLATGSFLGRSTVGTGNPEALTGTQATALLNAFTSALKGLVPPSGGGTVNFLRADGSFQPTVRYSLAVQSGVWAAPSPSAEGFFGGVASLEPAAESTFRRLYVPKAGRITGAQIFAWADGAAGSGESWELFIRKNGSDLTDTSIGTVSAAASERHWSNTALDIAVAAGDYIEILSVNPAWGPPPTDVAFGGCVYIES